MQGQKDSVPYEGHISSIIDGPDQTDQWQRQKGGWTQTSYFRYFLAKDKRNLQWVFQKYIQKHKREKEEHREKKTEHDKIN